MIAVVLAGLAMGTTIGLQRRRDSLRRLAQVHADAARQSSDALWDPRIRDQASAILDWQRLAYHNRLKEKYERAAARPWLPVPPD